LDEWSAWASDNNIHPLVLAWVRQNPMVFQSYKDTKFDKSLHESGQGVFRYIFHPTENNVAYVCPRTLELASHQLHNMSVVGDDLTERSLIGLLGISAAKDMMTYASLGGDLPHPDDILHDPQNARVPKNGVAKVMMVYKSLQYLNRETIDKYAEYMPRLGLETMSLWVKALVDSQNVKAVGLANQRVRMFAIENSWVLA
jgi:hypothetical protein